MTPNDTIRALLAGAEQATEEQERADERIAARMAWVSEAIAALTAAQKRVDEAWERMLETLPDDADDEEELPDPPEQAELDALWAELKAVRDRDMWPRELYWSL